MEGGDEQEETKKPSTFNKSAQNGQQLFARFFLKSVKLNVIRPQNPVFTSCPPRCLLCPPLLPGLLSTRPGPT
jgi:hypothetical protein